MEVTTPKPDELGVSVTMTSAPEGQPTIALVSLWNGDKLQGERETDQLQALGKPQLAQVGPMTYTDMLAPIDTQLAEVAACHWETRTRALPALSAGAASLARNAPRLSNSQTSGSAGMGLMQWSNLLPVHLPDPSGKVRLAQAAPGLPGTNVTLDPC
jgi:hypothetical protein